VSEHELSWDSTKAEINLDKHGVSFKEAAEALNDGLAMVRPDHAHSEYENRYILIGETIESRMITVVFTFRGDDARIISARTSTSAERRKHMSSKTVIRDAPRKPEMLDEYGLFDGWQQNPFQFRKAASAIFLDPDVAAVYVTSAEVNEALRSLMKRKTRSKRLVS
jgi:uncharacterized DUF497 family protein